MPIVGGIIKRAFSLADKVQGLGQTPFELQRKTLQRLLKKAEYTAKSANCDPSIDHLSMLSRRIKSLFAVSTINKEVVSGLRRLRSHKLKPALFAT